MGRLTPLRAALEPPVFADPAETIRAANIHFMALAILLMNSLGIPVGLAIIGLRPVLAAPLLGMLACLGCLELVKRKRLLLAGGGMAALLFLANTALVLNFGMLLGSSFGGYLGVVIAAGLVAGTRAAVATMIGSSAVGAWLAFGGGPEEMAAPRVDATWAIWTLYFGTAVGLIAIANRSIRSALHSVQLNQERFRVLTEGTRDLVSEFDRDNRILYASPNHEDVVGRSAESLIGQKVFEHSHPDDRRWLEGAPPATHHEQVPVRYQHADGHWMWLEVDALAYESPEGEPRIMAVSRDVTERHDLEEQLRQSQRLESVGRLAGGIAHDFNNLLTVIRGYTDLLQKHGPREELQEIADAADKATALIRRLLAFSRRQALQPQVVDMNEVVRGVEPLLRRLIGEDVALKTTLCSETARVLADPGQLEQVLVNLVVNARDAMPNGGRMSIETHTDRAVLSAPEGERSATQPVDVVELAVADSGEGMDDETVSHIFDPFFTTKGEGVGTGLGLSTVHGVVTQSGGSIQVDTKTGEGTIFRIRLPRTEDALTQGQASVEVPAPRSVEGATVLLADDNDALRGLLRRTLTAEGFHVLEAQDGSHALELAANHPADLDLLVTDLVMPNMGGVELFQNLQSQQPGLLTLFMTGHDQRGTAEGLAPLLLKPFSPSELMARIREMLGARARRAGTP